MFIWQIAGCPAAHPTEPLPREYLGPASFAVISHISP